MKTVIGLVKDLDAAKATMDELIGLGISPNSISVVSPQTKMRAPFAMNNLNVPGLGDVQATGPVVQQIKTAASGMGAADVLAKMGLTRKDAESYLNGVRHGDTLEAALVDDAKVEGALNVLRRHSSVNAMELKRNDEIRIPIVEEELFIGKREIDAGGVRVATHVASSPVERTVTVREEHIKIHRRPVDRPLDIDDTDPFGDKAFELRAMSEEPLVGKHAHVVEEIVIHKDIKEHTETVHDSVRKTKVDVAELAKRGDAPRK